MHFCRRVRFDGRPSGLHGQERSAIDVTPADGDRQWLSLDDDAANTQPMQNGGDGSVHCACDLI